MSINGEGPDGFPDLDREPITLGELPPRPSYDKLAQFYATVVIQWHRLWPKVVDAIMWLRGAWMGVRSAVERLEESVARNHAEAMGAITALAEEVRRRPSSRPRAPMPSFGAEQTQGGGIRLDGTMWDAVQRRLAENDEAIEQLQREKDLAEAEARGASKAVEALQGTSKRWREIVLFAIAVLGVAGSVVSWVLAHGAHP